ncbi:hypothetical protein V5O48_012514 [Marasmius crinis-equi]|uniref:Uncharacterized protein n=1 Tax=Marasmius crinis-equi TaxID=585013 RepID=A0ABR3F2N2_9AGAR
MAPRLRLEFHPQTKPTHPKMMGLFNRAYPVANLNTGEGLPGVDICPYGLTHVIGIHVSTNAVQVLNLGRLRYRCQACNPRFPHVIRGSPLSRQQAIQLSKYVIAWDKDYAQRKADARAKKTAEEKAENARLRAEEKAQRNEEKERERAEKKAQREEQRERDKAEKAREREAKRLEKAQEKAAQAAAKKTPKPRASRKRQVQSSPIPQVKSTPTARRPRPRTTPNTPSTPSNTTRDWYELPELDDDWSPPPLSEVHNVSYADYVFDSDEDLDVSNANEALEVSDDEAEDVASIANSTSSAVAGPLSTNDRAMMSTIFPASTSNSAPPNFTARKRRQEDDSTVLNSGKRVKSVRDRGDDLDETFMKGLLEQL